MRRFLLSTLLASATAMLFIALGVSTAAGSVRGDHQETNLLESLYPDNSEARKFELFFRMDEDRAARMDEG